MPLNDYIPSDLDELASAMVVIGMWAFILFAAFMVSEVTDLRQALDEEGCVGFAEEAKNSPIPALENVTVQKRPANQSLEDPDSGTTGTP